MTRSLEMYSWMKSKQRERLRTRNRVFAIISCTFITWWGLVLFYLVEEVTDSRSAGNSLLLGDHPVSDGAPSVIGTYSRWVDNTTEVVYAVSDTGISDNKGVALLLHACSHSALKFFSPSPSCEKCVGLSEELRISRSLLQLGYSVLAVTSMDRKSGCWAGVDIPKVQGALQEFQMLVPVSSPVIAIGASSGARFAAELANLGLAQAALSMVMNIGPDLRGKLIEKKGRMPPIYLAPMRRDKVTTKNAKGDFEEIKSMDFSAKVIFDADTCGPLPVTLEYLTERVPNMKESMADLIVMSLADAGHLDANFYFSKDPTKSNWREILTSSCADACLQGQELRAGLSPLAKALHRAWAFHEYCSEVIPKAIDYFEKSIIKKG